MGIGRCLGVAVLFWAWVAPAPASAVCDPVLITADVTIGAGDSQYEGMAVTVQGATVTIAGHHAFCRLALELGALLTHAPADTVGVDLEVSGSLLIDASSALDVSGKGHPHNSGPGRAPVGTNGGGGHGGQGGGGTSGGQGGPCYGSLFDPVTPGSGGGGATGGVGGGVVRLSVGDTLQVEGAIAADGEDGGLAGHGGGAGGSIRVLAGHLAGAGSVSAAGGGSGSGGGGGGGRIVMDLAGEAFAGDLTAPGGGGGVSGGAGTVLILAGPAGPRELRVDNAGLPFGARTELIGVDAVVADVRVGGGAVLDGLDGVSVDGDLHVAADGAVSADGRGYPRETGPGAGEINSGGGHGGAGGRPAGGVGGASYDSRTFPADLGSGGSGTTGGAGGGRIMMSVSGTLFLDGVVSADGDPPLNASHGAGSGGTVRLALGGLTGSGLITADGGQAVNSGGGGGGRIALFVSGCYAGFDVANQVRADGGGGAYPGAPGTRYFAHDRVAQVGGEDGYAPPAEAASPGADLAAALAGTALAGCDVDPAGGAFATTFAGVSGQAAGALLTLRVAAGADPAATGDRIVLGFADAGGFQERWSRHLGATGGAGDPGLHGGPWVAGVDTTLDLDLGALPLAGGGTVDLLAEMAARGQVDLVLEHHTLVDFVLLSHCTGSFDPSGVDDGSGPVAAPGLLRLEARPNPFNPRTTLGFRLERPAPVRLAIYDLRGRRVAGLLHEVAGAGDHAVTWNGRDDRGRAVASGVYFARLDAGGAATLRKLTLTK